MPPQLILDSTNRVALGNPAAPTGKGGLQDADTLAYVNDATVELLSIIAEETGAVVTGVTFPVAMGYVTSSNGVYKGKVPHTAVLVLGKHYELKIRAVTPGGDQIMKYSSVPVTKA